MKIKIDCVYHADNGKPSVAIFMPRDVFDMVGAKEHYSDGDGNPVWWKMAAKITIFCDEKPVNMPKTTPVQPCTGTL